MTYKSRKIINDPVYGFISLPYDILYELLDHPSVQRLRRIKQLGLTHFVYPGGIHTRLHHALGATHLMEMAIQTLKGKGVEITEEESKAALICILLHDIGHGPCSHALEGLLIDVSHEFLSIKYMEKLNDEMDGALDLAITIYKGAYHKPFLHELISSQLDMDRMDYLNRDSYFTGVAEGIIGFNRIIKMLNVIDGHIVIEEKGIYSIEKFLMARRIMYWQVYLHKTAVSAEQMLIKLVKLVKKDDDFLTILKKMDHPLNYFLGKKIGKSDFETDEKEILQKYDLLDDHDIYFLIKLASQSKTPILAYFGRALLDRKLMKIIIQDEPFSTKKRQEIRLKISKSKDYILMNVEDLIIEGKESNLAYNINKEPIKVLTKSGKVVPISKFSGNLVHTSVIVKHFLCFPKILC